MRRIICWIVGHEWSKKLVVQFLDMRCTMRTCDRCGDRHDAYKRAVTSARSSKLFRGCKFGEL